ncbi:hypothetical protein MishRS11D_08740 [Methylomagnum ishizawai]|nr:hypothetical protein MishRS11D_08740 [Methylomagnum ishizawai]
MFGTGDSSAGVGKALAGAGYRGGVIALAWVAGGAGIVRYIPVPGRAVGRIPGGWKGPRRE